MLLESGTACASDDYRVWVEPRIENGLWVVTARAASTKSEMLHYELIARKQGDGNNKSSVHQSGKIAFQQGDEKVLGKLKMGRQQAAHYVFSVKLYSGKEVVAQAIAEY